MKTKTNEWQRIYETKYVECHRAGWIGVFDALKSAITGNHRLVVVKPLSFGIWIKADIDTEILIGSASLELSE